MKIEDDLEMKKMIEICEGEERDRKSKEVGRIEEWLLVRCVIGASGMSVPTYHRRLQ